MLIPTGKREIRPCDTCGLVVLHYEAEAHTHPDDGTDPEWVKFWRPVDNHDAPCGLPCFSCGVSPAVYRSGQYHRDGCEKCGQRGVL